MRASAAVPLCLLGIGVNLLIFGPGALRLAAQGATDFRVFYAAAHLTGSGTVYDIRALMEQQRQAGFEPVPHLVYNRLPYFAAVVWPISKTPYPVAHWIWFAVQFGALAGFMSLWRGV